MRKTVVFLALLAGSSLFGDETTGPLAAAAEVSSSDPRVELLQAASNPEVDFIAAYETAKNAGLSEALLLEGRVVKMLQTGDLRGLIGMIDKIEARRSGFAIGFDPTGEKIYAFVSQQQVEGLIQALRAVKAYQAEETDAFLENASAAFLAWPQFADLFQLGKLVQEARNKEVVADYVAGLVVPMETPMRNLDGSATTLGDLFKDGHKAVLLDFWASWCGPCMRLMPELKARAEVLPSQGVFVAAVNTDSEDPLTKAATVKAEKAMEMPWLVEAEGEPLSTMLLIDSIPRMILIAPDGHILFNGHPLDDELVEALAALGVTLPKTDS